MNDRVLMLGFDAMDPQITRAMCEQGRLPAFAQLLLSGARCPVRNPAGLFVGALWSTFFTGRSAERTGFHCWEEIVPGSYERRLTGAESIRGRPFWESLSDAGRRVAVLDVPHSRAGFALNGIQLSEWGCHDRHFGLRTYPPSLAEDLLRQYGAHPVLGADAQAVREWAPDDYVFRKGPLRSSDEEQELLDAMLTGIERKRRMSTKILAEEPWDLFLSIFGETHSIGHQSWHVHDRSHPRHDPQLRARIGDPLAQVYEQMDAALADHLRLADDDALVLVLLSHGIGPHNDATHLLPEILRRLDAAYSGEVRRSWQRSTLGGIWKGASPSARSHLGPVIARRLRTRPAGTARDGETAQERQRQRFFMAPNNFVVGGIRLNLRGREREGLIKTGAEADALCERLRDDLLDLVNVDTGTPVVTEVSRTDAYYQRDRLDALPDLFLEWNHEHPIETIWSPRFGLIHGPYLHWRTGDHRPGGLLLVRSPRTEPGAELPELATEDLAPSISARLGVDLEDVDGVVADWATDSGARRVTA